jgi:hypothetical protein
LLRTALEWAVVATAVEKKRRAASGVRKRLYAMATIPYSTLMEEGFILWRDGAGSADGAASAAAVEAEQAAQHRLHTCGSTADTGKRFAKVWTVMPRRMGRQQLIITRRRCGSSGRSEITFERQRNGLYFGAIDWEQGVLATRLHLESFCGWCTFQSRMPLPPPPFQINLLKINTIKDYTHYIRRPPNQKLAQAVLDSVTRHSV